MRGILTQSKSSKFLYEIRVINAYVPQYRFRLSSWSHVNQSELIYNLPESGNEKLKREGKKKSFVGRYSKLFSALFSDFPKERERDSEEAGKGGGGRQDLPGSYKLRYGCNVPVVYYIAGSKPGQCNGPPPSLPRLSIYIYNPPRTPSPQSCLPTGDASPSPTVGLFKVRTEER